MVFLTLSGFVALKWKCRQKEECGRIMPWSWDTLNSFPSSSRPLSFQATGRAVLLFSVTIRLSCLESRMEEAGIAVEGRTGRRGAVG